jgi:hypothetical protein
MFFKLPVSELLGVKKCGRATDKAEATKTARTV